MTAEEKALQKTIDDAVSKAVAEALSKVSSNAPNKADNAQQKVMHTRALNVSQSKELVGFKPSANHGSMVKGKIYPVSENVAEILELKELGSKCDLPKKAKK